MKEYLCYQKAKGAILICPGGGYNHLSDREGEPIAKAFNLAGYNAYVINYSINPTHFPQPLVDAAKGMAYVRQRSIELGIDPNHIGIIGFSAGGHVAGSVGVHWNNPFLHDASGLSGHEIKPNACILSYPVISNGEFKHEGSFINLIGENPTDEERQLTSLELNVTTDMPPTFIWHTVADATVPVENALLMMKALQESGIPFEGHIYPSGSHGIALANEFTATNAQQVNNHVAGWHKLAVEWIDDLFGY